MIPEPDSIVFNVSGSSDEELCLGACDGEMPFVVHYLVVGVLLITWLC